MTRSTTRAASFSGRAEGLAQGLGWFSIGLGLAELLAPRALTRALGMRGSETLVQAYGAREIATGLGILGSDNPRPWIIGRLVGDGLDVATLASAYHDRNPRRGNVGLALAMVAGVALLDFLAAEALAEDERARPAARRSDGAWTRMLADYRGRSGWPRGAPASKPRPSDDVGPGNYRIAQALKPWRDGHPETDASPHAARAGAA
jgi:hypothetical protein